MTIFLSPIRVGIVIGMIAEGVMLPHSQFGIRVRGCRTSRVENWGRVYSSGKHKKPLNPRGLSLAMLLAKLTQVAHKIPFYRSLYPQGRR